MKKVSEIAGYFAVKMSADGQRPAGWWLGPDIAGLADWKKRQAENKDSGEPKNVSESPLPIDQSLHTQIGHSELDKKLIILMLRFRDAMAAARGLVLIEAVTPIVQIGTLLARTIPYAEKNLDPYEDVDGFKVFSFDFESYIGLVRELRSLGQIEQGMKTIPSAALMNMVAIFDSYFSEIIRVFILQYPEKFNNSARTITIKDVIGLKSIEDIYSYAVDGEINSLMREGHREQIEYVEKNLSIAIISGYERWPQFIEIFERRNLAAHNNLIINSIYMSECIINNADISDKKVGDHIDISSAYLMGAIDVLAEFGLLLIFSLWLKHNSESTDACFSIINEICVEFIRDNRTTLAIRLLDCVSKIKKSGCSDRMLKVIHIHLANAYKKGDDKVSCEKVLKKIDWSATGVDFKLCLASLRDDIDLVIELLPKAINEVSAMSFRDWPVLDWIRDDSRVISQFEEIYGESLKSNTKSENISDGENIMKH